MFENSIRNMGIHKLGHTSGVAWADYDSDDDLDLLIVGGIDGTKLFRNDRWRFTDVTAKAFDDRRSGLVFAEVFGDYDNDGCPDLYVTGAGSNNEPGAPDRLYHNNCDGTFTNVTENSGIQDLYHGRAAAWGDYNGDGYLDIYVANHGDFRKTEYIHEPNMLYKNNGNGTFTNVTTEANVVGVTECPGIRQGDPRVEKTIGGAWKFSFQPLWFDYNNDNKIDLFITNDSGVSPLYKNNGDGTFTDVTRSAGLCVIGTGMGVAVGDYDNNGYFDLYVTNTGANYLWRNLGDGTFSEEAAQLKVADHKSLGWGAAFFDYDNDGDLDLYVVNGRVSEELEWNPEIGKIMLDKLFQNDGKGGFVDVADKEGVLGDDAKEAAALADYNQDGFIDIFVASSYLELISKHRLYKNRGNDNNWLTIKLKGKYSNREGVGAKIRVSDGERTQQRQVISGSSYISQDSLWQTFGLGTATAVEVTVDWPSGIVQKLENVGTNQKITIMETEN